MTPTEIADGRHRAQATLHVVAVPRIRLGAVDAPAVHLGAGAAADRATGRRRRGGGAGAGIRRRARRDTGIGRRQRPGIGPLRLRLRLGGGRWCARGRRELAFGRQRRRQVEVRLRRRIRLRRGRRGGCGWIAGLPAGRRRLRGGRWLDGRGRLRHGRCGRCGCLRRGRWLGRRRNGRRLGGRGCPWGGRWLGGRGCPRRCRWLGWPLRWGGGWGCRWWACLGGSRWGAPLRRAAGCRWRLRLAAGCGVLCARGCGACWGLALCAAGWRWSRRCWPRPGLRRGCPRSRLGRAARRLPCSGWRLCWGGGWGCRWWAGLGGSRRGALLRRAAGCRWRLRLAAGCGVLCARGCGACWGLVLGAVGWRWSRRCWPRPGLRRSRPRCWPRPGLRRSRPRCWPRPGLRRSRPRCWPRPGLRRSRSRWRWGCRMA